MSVSIMIDPQQTSTCALPQQLTFVEPPPGMSALTRFDVAALDALGLMFTLRATDHVETRLFAVSPRPYFPSYAPRISEDVRGGIGMHPGDEPVLLVIVNPTADGLITANLLAPVAINPATGAAAQAVLDDEEWPLRAPLSAEAAAT
ncbi:flagellar assembly protein FliW [Demequina aestuarii]|uniref:flagellar assembly protein FliW n=1 Tax=Demequina aestuarii TaxID=327095 RepID=UPI000782992D|nr:flagellar assembly protein FliW [Demequina aestuarii]